MIMTDPASVIVALFDQMMDWHSKMPILPEGEENKYGMMFTLEIDCANNGYERDGNTHHPEWERRYTRFLHIIALRPRMVFVHVSENWDWRASKLEDFQNTSNHDSCWRSDGLRLITEEYFNAARECWDHVPEEHRRAPFEANVNGSLNPILRPILHFVKVEHEPFARNGHDYYWRKLTLVQEIKARLSFE